MTIAAVVASACSSSPSATLEDRRGAPPARQSAVTVVAWPMDVTADKATDESRAAAISLSGKWRRVSGAVGQAVEFYAAPALGTAPRLADDSPGARDFAMGQVFKTKTIPRRYSGNLMQKGFYGDPAQMKMQLVAAGGGTVECRLKGSAGSTMLTSPVVVDDGRWHSAVCWREADMVGLTVDGISRSARVQLGVVSNERPVRVGNKSTQADWTDQLFGAIDCIVYATGVGSHDAASAALPC
jgi:hypothetical protein